MLIIWKCFKPFAYINFLVIKIPIKSEWKTTNKYNYGKSKIYRKYVSPQIKLRNQLN